MANTAQSSAIPTPTETTVPSARTQFDYLVAQPGKQSVSDLLAFYDSLEPIEPDFLLGHFWNGGEFNTGLWINGLLGVSDWYGKAFYTVNKVEALVHRFRLLSPLGLIGRLLSFWRRMSIDKTYYQLPLGVARLRQVVYRGKLSTGMAYNHLPIIDHFRRVDADTVMGVMDHRDRPQEMIIFYLQREQPL